MMAEYTKADVLRTLLDTQQLCLDLFDSVEAEHLVIDRALIHRVGNLTRRIRAVHDSFVEQYLMSGRGGDDLLADVRKSVLASPVREGNPRASGEERYG